MKSHPLVRSYFGNRVANVKLYPFKKINHVSCLYQKQLFSLAQQSTKTGNRLSLSLSVHWQQSPSTRTLKFVHSCFQLAKLEVRKKGGDWCVFVWTKTPCQHAQNASNLITTVDCRVLQHCCAFFLRVFLNISFCIFWPSSSLLLSRKGSDSREDPGGKGGIQRTLPG